MAFHTDQALWYNNGVWGELGYAVPNFAGKFATVNQNIHYLVDVMGQNLFGVMHGVDADMKTPPSFNTIVKIHKLIVRARQIMTARAVPPGTADMEPTHVSPAPMAHLLYPVPFFKVRNKWLKQYCGLVLMALAEATQHTENRKAIEFSVAFAGTIGQYLQRIYVMVATELLGIDAAKAREPAFTITDADLRAYDPAKWFSATEMVDTLPPIVNIPTEDDLAIFANGIPANLLVGLQRYPLGDGAALPDANAMAAAANAAGGVAAGTASPTSTGAFAPAPGP